MADETPEIECDSSEALPPYGLLNSGFRRSLGDRNPPPDWLTECDETPVDRKKRWELWREEQLELLAKVLWPIHCESAGKQVWRGKSIEWMHDLTKTDLALMLDMQQRPSGPEFDKVPASPLRTTDCPTHRELFDPEDGGDKYKTFRFYDRTAGDELVEAMPLLCVQGLRRKDGSTSLQFKERLQRPRPLQTALRFGFREKFAFLNACSSLTPSMSSGHCLQSLLAVGYVLERLLDDKIPLGLQSRRSLIQWAVDIGDRRVLAGVHYPSDNISSWIIFTLLADKVFHQPDVKRILWDAVIEQSYVYSEIQRWVSIGQAKVYCPALELLNGK